MTKSRDPEDKASEGAMGEQAADTGEREVGRFEGDEHGSSPDVEPGDRMREAGKKSQAGLDTHAASKAQGPIEVVPAKGTDKVGQSINKQGNRQSLGRKNEPGRFEEGVDDAGRPIGKSTARFSSGVNPLEAIDKDMPDAPPGDAGG